MKLYINNKLFDPTNMTNMFKNVKTLTPLFDKTIKRKIRSRNRIFYKKYLTW